MDVAEMTFWIWKKFPSWGFALLPLLVMAQAVKLAVFGALIAGESHSLVFFYKLAVFGALSVLAARPLLLRRTPGLLILAYLAQSAYLCMVLAYFRYSSNYLTLVQMAAMAGEAWDMVASRAITFHPQMLLLFLDLPVLLLCAGLHSWLRRFHWRWGAQWKPAALVSLAILFTIETVNVATGKSLWNPNNAYESASVVRRYGTLANGMVGILKYRTEKDLVASLDYGPLRVGAAVSEARPNFRIIQVESLGSNVMKAFYEGKPVTPRLRQYAMEGVFVPYALSHHKGGGSSDAEFCALNSVEPFDGFVAMKLRNYGYPNSMVKQLKKLGYAAKAFHGNHREFYNRRAAYHGMGFDEFRDRNAMGLAEVGWGAPDEEVFASMEKSLLAETGPFFYYAITLSSHQPFRFHLKGDDAKGFDHVKDIETRDFLRSMAYTDRVIGAFLDRLRANGPKNTYVLIYGDHPTPVDNGYYRGCAVKSGGALLEFVPMIVLTPNGEKRMELGNVASYLDVAPTVLEAAGGGYRLHTRGANLLGRLEPKRELPVGRRIYWGLELFGLASPPPQVDKPFLSFVAWEPAPYPLASSASMAPTSTGSSGVTSGAKRATISP